MKAIAKKSLTEKLAIIGGNVFNFGLILLLAYTVYKAVCILQANGLLPR